MDERYNVEVVLVHGGTLELNNVMGFPILRGGSLVLDLPTGKWYRIPSENVAYWIASKAE